MCQTHFTVDKNLQKKIILKNVREDKNILKTEATLKKTLERTVMI